MKTAAARVTSDTLVIVGEADHMVTPGPALEFARLIHAEVLELSSDCGHMVFRCESENVGRAIRDFFSSKKR